MADFVFYRTFDVGQCVILDKIDDQIAGTDVKFIFNQLGSLKRCPVHNFGVNDKHASENAMETNERVIFSKLNSPQSQIPEDYRQEEQRPVVGEKLACNDRLETVNCKTASSLEVKENSDVIKVSLSQREKTISGIGTDSGELAKINDRMEKTSEDKIGLSHKVREIADLKGSLVKQKGGSSEKIGSVVNSIDNQVKVDEKLKSVKDSGESEERPYKKAKLDSSVKASNDKTLNSVLKSSRDSDGSNSKPLASNIEDESKCAIDPSGPAKNTSKMLKIDDKIAKSTNYKLPKESTASQNAVKTDKALKVTSRPDSDRSKWFAELPWEERMQDAHEHGTLVLFQNLDPAYSSAEVEEMVFNVFKETCRAKMVQHTAYSSRHYGQAFAIFKRTEVAEEIVRKLDEECLLLPNLRPLVASIPNPCFLKKQSAFAGHLIVDKLKSQREMKEAVSTSHSSQPNTLEYDMAMEWRLLIERSDQFWKKIYEQQGRELKNMKANFKSK